MRPVRDAQALIGHRTGSMAIMGSCIDIGIDIGIGIGIDMFGTGTGLNLTGAGVTRRMCDAWMAADVRVSAD